MTNIVLCGGSGTRLWPLSRHRMPKQFVKLFKERSLFQLTTQRNRQICERSIIVTNSEHFFLATDQLEEISMQADRFLLEPFGKNTAPALALACFDLPEEETILVTPSDHLIENEEIYFKTLERGERLAKKGLLVTFGITPTYSETGYGYIEKGDAIENETGYKVRRFHEKPDNEMAINYLQSGNFYWNSGMFCFRAGDYLNALKQWAPDIYESSKTAYQKAKRSSDKIIRITHEQMEKIPAASIDVAVMERCTQAAVVPSDFHWSDLGSFDALYESLPKDENGTALLRLQNSEKSETGTSGDLIGINSEKNLIISQKPVAAIDVEDLIVVDTDDAMLIAKRGSSQKVRKVVEALEKAGSSLTSIHKTVHRPWGTYTVLEDAKGYKIKKIVVKPGKRLSLQKHFHRNEHWIVVSGTATVMVGEKTYYVRPNESTYIKMGETHRLANEGKIPVVLIEAQVGEYTEEDDIVRLDDDYARSRS